MASRVLPGTDVRVRRGRRRDLSEIGAILGVEVGVTLARLWRRTLADLGTDCYVAEDPAEGVVGVVSVVYARSLVQGGTCATLDGVRTRRAGPVLEGLVAFAERRAERRGCRSLRAWVAPDDAELRRTLLARGYRAGEILEAELGSAA